MTKTEAATKCYGKGALHDISNYTSVNVDFENNKSFDMIFPVAFEHWFTTWITAVFLRSRYRGKRNIQFIYIIGDVLNNGHQKQGIVGMYFVNDDMLFFVMSKKFAGYLKLAKPDTGICEHLRSLAKITWHEIHHFRKNKGSPFLNDREFADIADLFWEIRKGKS